ncbi:MAG TPA: hypothetical protein VGH80_08930 [Xanthomonadaceae bacterium]
MARVLWFFLLLVLSLAASAQTLAPHPRLLLDGPTLATLHARMGANTPQWQQLKNYCDSFIGGKVDLPDGNAYPDPPDIGQGYQGSSYWSAVLAEGLCYQTMVASDPTDAQPYGAKTREILLAMSTPYTGSGSHGQNPCTDDGYGTRFFGVGMGIGYDWAWPLLSDADRLQIYTTANAWLTSFKNPSGCSGFEYAHPQSNYFAGFFHADAAIALATYDENPNGPALWTDWLNSQFATAASNPPHIGVQPYYNTHLTGGGWPEGFGNYGPLGTLNMSLPVIEAKTAAGLDLVHSASAPYSFPIDAADYLMHFTWPSRKYIDDRDTNHATGTATPPVGTADTGMFMHVLGSLRYWNAPEANVFQAYTNAVNTNTSGYGASEPWELFLFWDPSGKTKAITTLPLSYFATGMNAVAARSDWTTTASWMSFRAGPYVNNPGQGEELFDQGGLALVRGGLPLLVNGTGQIVHEPHGDNDENRIYTDTYGDFDGSVYAANRTIDNIFYVRRMDGSKVVTRYGQAAYTAEDDGVQTHVASYEDGTKYVDVLADKLENMYRPDKQGKPQVSSWSREIVYLRPNRFVVYDRTREAAVIDDQFLAFHFPALPTAGSAPAGGHRFNVTYKNIYAGAMTTVLPANATTKTIAMYPPNDGDPGSNPDKVWQVQVRPPDTTAVQQWLTVFDTSTSATLVATASRIVVTTGAATGVLLAGGGGNSAVIVNTHAAGTTIAGTIAYAVPAAATTHVVTELQPNKAYTVTATPSGGNHAISIVPAGNGALKSSARGVLLFDVAANGTVTAN